MVCEHCGEVLESRLCEAGFQVKRIELGGLELEHPVDEDQFAKLSNIVRQNGFEIISEKSNQIVERIKHLIIDIIHQQKTLEENLSNFLEEKIHKDYQHLSRLFSGVEGKSIERYFILQKIERAKELIVYGEQTDVDLQKARYEKTRS